MKVSRTLLGTGVLFAVGAAATVGLLRGGWQGERHFRLLDRHCMECHSAAEQSGGVVFEGLGPGDVPARAEIFEAAVRKLRGRLMPPPGEPQPGQAEIDGLVAWLESTLDEAAEPTAGYVPIQRLNRTEYAGAVKALLGVEIDPAEHLPTEIEVDGFTNVAAALSVSPAFIDQYINVASTVAHLAVGEPRPKLASAYFPPPATDQTAYVDGMPLGTRGGIRFTHTFPADGEYRLTLTNLGFGLYPRALETEHTLVVLVDRDEVFRQRVGGAEDLAFMDKGGAPARAELMERFTNIPLEVRAGIHELIVTFVERARSADDEMISSYSPSRSFSFTGAPRVPGIVGGVELTGPFESTGLSRTASREKLFICEPEVAERERDCAERITANLARRAFRRPVDQADLDRLMPFFEEGRRGPGGFDAGIEQVVTAVLASPDFLYRAIAPPEESAAGVYPLTDLELATRLAFFLWSQGPDDELLALAAAGELDRPGEVDAQIDRMLADPRAGALVENFALGWLNLDDLDAVQPDSQIFPGFTEELREDFAEEIDLFLRSVLLEDRNVQELLTAGHTFLNERLARHYGVPGVLGPQFRRVELADETRYGLLGKGAVLLRTSYGDRTSPVLRGAWVLEKLAGTPPAPPPPGVETDLTTPPGEQPKTVRARLEQHRKDQVCNACHGVIDPYGLALENFTVVGAWRERDEAADAPIDPRAVLPGGRSVSGPIELRAALLARPDQFVQALTQKLMMYALGRELEYRDMPQVRAIVREAAGQDYRFSALVKGVVASPAFRMQTAPRDEASDSVRLSLNVSGAAIRQTNGE